jgi:hypothetical protein
MSVGVDVEGHGWKWMDNRIGCGIGLDWNSFGLDWIGLDWMWNWIWIWIGFGFGLDWIGLDSNSYSDSKSNIIQFHMIGLDVELD